MAEIPGPSNLTASADTVTTTVTQDVALVQVFDAFKRRCFLSMFVQPARNIFINNVNKQKFSPLEGIKVLDLTRIVAGPFCTMILGDLGADVIKVEQPKIGDESRTWGPFINETNISSYFISLNRNKRSVCVNLKTAPGVVIVKELVKTCDVLVENYVPGKLDSFGLGFDELSKIAPHLIYCSITGYGQNGPYRLRPGVDVIAASCGGLLHLTGPEDGEPCRPGIASTDLATGIYAYGAIMTALFQRQKTGVGQKIDCNLLSTQISCLINNASSYLNVNKEACRLGTGHTGIVPYQMFPTADGYITICAMNNAHFRSLCEVLELGRLLADDRFATNCLRVKNRKVLIKILKDRFTAKSTKEWLAILKGSAFPCGPVNSISEVFEDEHVREIELVKEMLMDSFDTNEEKCSPLKIKLVGPAVEFSCSENKVRFPPPALGQHTSEVLKHVLNYSDDKVETLMKNGDVS